MARKTPVRKKSKTAPKFVSEFSGESISTGLAIKLNKLSPDVFNGGIANGAITDWRDFNTDLSNAIKTAPKGSEVAKELQELKSMMSDMNEITKAMSQLEYALSKKLKAFQKKRQESYDNIVGKEYRKMMRYK